MPYKDGGKVTKKKSPGVTPYGVKSTCWRNQNLENRSELSYH